MKIERLGRTRVLIAGALAVPVVLGSVAFANASSSDEPNHSSNHGTSQLTEEGKDLAKNAPFSGSVSADLDGITTGGSDEASEGKATGSAKLTPAGEKMVAESGTTSGSVSAGPDGIVKH